MALPDGSSLIMSQARSDAKTVSNGIIIPTSAAGIYLGAIVISVNDTVTTPHIATTYQKAPEETISDGAN
jgi:hypothetical protein